FGAVVSGWDVQRGKPDPEVFLKAAAGIGVEPRNCLVIEDVPAGIQAAHAAGMKCVAVTTTHEAGALVAADRIMDGLTELTVQHVSAMLGRG
ncbi:MAG: HAD family phosphatase, partial [Candidatus Brocadiae bacterium]|nr:HAD family phosphatase [Candidatus Brocadiia bacterium]